MCEITAVRMFAALALLVSASTSALAGPPFQTDDPEPIEFRNYEFYMFATSDGTPVETDIFGPALEFNWGALPNVHIHVIIPAATILPENNPSFNPCRRGPAGFRFRGYRTGNQIPVCAGNEASSHDRHIYNVRGSDRQRRERSGGRRDMV